MSILFTDKFLSLFNYLLFHSLAEIFSIVVAFGIFVIAWNSRNFIQNNYLLFIGIAYLSIAALDLLHTLAYTGMGVFTGFDSNLPTQLWIASRYVESISLLIAPFLLERKIKPNAVFSSYTVVFSLLILFIFYFQTFPECYIEGVGLTLFKKISEYIISSFLLAAAYFLYRKRERFDKNVFQLLILSILVTIISELCFTFYISVYGLFNLIGHFMKIISFYFIYKAIIETGFQRPYTLLFKELKESNDQLAKVLVKVRQLSGLLPICASCKRIRDDEGYWSNIEMYIEEHSEAEFSHSICPECARKLYPKYYKEKG